VSALEVKAQKARLKALIQNAEKLFVITGAGCSAPSGIDTYRDDAGEWRRAAPIQHQDFVNSERARQRYWARSMRGWPMFQNAVPNAAHSALVTLEQTGHLQRLVTQNVDGLHQRAGQNRLIELHGSLDLVICLSCGKRQPREPLQAWLEAENGHWLIRDVRRRPDGDAEFVEVEQFDTIVVPACNCGGTLKPDVVFFGDSVPKARVAAVRADLAEADALLVIGSSLMVYSSFRFVREARQLGLPIAAVNRGATRADDYFDCKWEADSAVAMSELVGAL
jgi:NAD-dependent SIR2 family protein deacetylase